jgi:hypothetical protein
LTSCYISFVSQQLSVRVSFEWSSSIGSKRIAFVTGGVTNGS